MNAILASPNAPNRVNPHGQVLENGGGGSGQGEGGDDDRALLRLLLQGALDLGANDMVHWEVFYKWHQRWGRGGGEYCTS